MALRSKLFEAGKIGTMEVKNRLVMAPIGTASNSVDGFIEQRTIDYYVARAKGGVGLIMGQTSVALRIGRAPSRPGTWDDKFIPGLARLAEEVHRHDVKIAWQVNYHGKLLYQWLNQIDHPEEVRVLGPSAVPWSRTGKAPEEASPADIEYMLENWSDAARRIKEAGFDAVEIHGAHGYGITQWLSPRDNLRKDEYGGSPERRARFACELIARVRQKVGPGFPILFRMNGSDYLPGGITLEDSLVQAPLFVKAGADALDISAGNEESTQYQFPPYFFPDGLHVDLAAAIKKVVSVPVITVGKISLPEMGERILSEGKADFIAIGRPLLADPDLPNKILHGHRDEVRHCIYCNNCYNLAAYPASERGLGRSCTVNPALLREKDFEIKAAAKAKRVMVIGGGVAGMEAARVLAERGHRVSLFEKSHSLGGQFALGARQPHKSIFNTFLDYQRKGMEKAGVEVLLQTDVSMKLLEQIKPDVTVIATGAVPLTPNIPGVQGRNVVYANDVVANTARVGKKVVVVGGRLLGMEVALQLAEQQKQVTLTTLHLLGENGLPVEINTYRALRNSLFKAGVQVFEKTPAGEIRDNGVYLLHHGEPVFFEADTVVLAVGSKSERTLVEQIRSAGYSCFEIGDCVTPSNALEAVRDGARVGRQI